MKRIIGYVVVLSVLVVVVWFGRGGQTGGQGEPSSRCDPALPGTRHNYSLDSNGDGKVDLSDAVHLLGFLFLGTEPPQVCLADDFDLSCIFCDPNGNVGIGTMSPQAPLHVDGDIRIGRQGSMLVTDVVPGNSVGLGSRSTNDGTAGWGLFPGEGRIVSCFGTQPGTCGAHEFSADGGVTIEGCRDGWLSYISNEHASGKALRVNLPNATEDAQLFYVGTGSGWGAQAFSVTARGVGIGTGTAEAELDVAGDIKATGTVMSGSSRELKEAVADLSAEEARETVACLTPVTFRYKADESKDNHVGFIAEDSPDLITSPDKKSISAMDVVAVLTKVVQEQQQTIEVLENRLKTLEARVKSE